MQPGLYEQLITRAIEEKLDRNRFHVGERELSSDEAANWLARHLMRIFSFSVGAVPEGKNRLKRQIDLSNRLLQWLMEQIQDEGFLSDNLIDTPARVLTALLERRNPIAADLPRHLEETFPLTGLSESELFSGGNADLSLESELRREILSADEICWLVSFIRLSGLRLFLDALKTVAESGRRIRVLTTTYVGATEEEALNRLAALPSTEVRVSYDGSGNRLHAKSYLFLRSSGFHTGYIGSSNLSAPAVTTGLEWNLKITAQEIPHVIRKALRTFETWWASPDFEPYDASAESRSRLHAALTRARPGQASRSPREPLRLDVRPYPHQEEILDQLEAERRFHGRQRNLVVAATGTGKTLLSAFDFARYRRSRPEATLLFVAHRIEILEQARAAFQAVLGQHDFGELWAGGERPAHYRHLFASVQTLNARLDVLPLSADHYDYIAIDEVHHVAAASYRRLLTHFQPRVLLGLTATPERPDGSDILADFGGTIAAELRLPEAINRGLLSPFQYFVIDDETDLRKVRWVRGRYDRTDLTNLYTGDHERVRRIIGSMGEILGEVERIRALAFCVSRDHARFMCHAFQQRGIRAGVLTSDNREERDEKRQALRSGRINVLCVVDIFNEGVDLPEIDTLLFLRPTESLTIFLQQLGRGLRRADDKPLCTVLDFVGNANAEYDFAGKLRALVGRTRRPIDAEINEGFPHAPLGCSIRLSPKARELILKNIRRATFGAQRILALIRRFDEETQLEPTLGHFLRFNPGLDPETFYLRGKSTFTMLRARMAGETLAPGLERLAKIHHRAINRRLLGCDGLEYLSFVRDLAENDFVLKPSEDRRLGLMCHYDFWDLPGPPAGFQSLDESLRALHHPTLKPELLDLLTLLIDRIQHLQHPMPRLENVPLALHARYSRDQILTAFGATSFDRAVESREGVYRLSDANIELLFVTLRKNPKHFTPSTMYDDYAISRDRFHWQSQNSSRPERGRGREYIEHRSLGKRLFLFVREEQKDSFGRTTGFVNFGEVEYISHEGSQPMGIVWRLETPMPAFMWQDAAKLAAG